MLQEPNKSFLTIYLCGTMLGGELQKQTVDWRYKIRKHYSNWKGQGFYEMNFLDPWNGEVDAEIDDEGLTNSKISGKAIYAGDVQAIKKSDLIVANLNQFNSPRPSIGSFMECGMALAWNKPLIIIIDEKNYERYCKHPFTSQACAMFKSVDELLQSKILNWFYKRVNTAIYDWKV